MQPGPIEDDDHDWNGCDRQREGQISEVSWSGVSSGIVWSRVWSAGH